MIQVKLKSFFVNYIFFCLPFFFKDSIEYHSYRKASDTKKIFLANTASSTASISTSSATTQPPEKNQFVIKWMITNSQIKFRMNNPTPKNQYAAFGLSEDQEMVQ